MFSGSGYLIRLLGFRWFPTIIFVSESYDSAF